MCQVSFEPEFSDEGLSIGEYARVAVMLWAGHPTSTRMERAGAALDAIARRLPGPLSLLAVIEAQSPPPLLEDLPVAVRAFDRFGGALIASVAVLEARGATSVALDLLASVHAQRQKRTPAKFCADASEGVTWLAARHPHPHPTTAFRAGVLDAIEQVRGQRCLAPR